MKKRVLLLVFAFMAAVVTNAQIIRSSDLEKYAKEKYGKKWIEAAKNLSSELKLDKNNALTYVQVIQAPGKSKDQLYILLNHWFNSMLDNAKDVIQLNDKDLGTIIVKAWMDVAEHIGGMNSYSVRIMPIVKCDIKDDKIRVTYTIPYYIITKKVGGGWTSIVAGPSKIAPEEQKWLLEQCYPFAEKDSHKKSSSKALIMSHAFSNVIIDKIEECVKNGLTGTEDENW